MYEPLFTAPERLSAAWSAWLVNLVDWALPLWIAALIVLIVADRVRSSQRRTRVMVVQREVEGGPYRGGFVDESVLATEEQPWRARFWRRAGVNAVFATLGALVWLAAQASGELSRYRTLHAVGHTVEAPVLGIDEWVTRGRNCECRHYSVTAQLPDKSIVRDLSSTLGARYAKLEMRVPWTMGPDGMSQIGRVEDVGIRALPGVMIPLLLAGLLLGHARALRRVSN